MHHLIWWPLQPHEVLSFGAWQYLCCKQSSAFLKTTNLAKYWRNSSEQAPGLNELLVQRQKNVQNTWTCILTKSYDRKSPVCHANVIGTRVTEVRNCHLLSIPDPKRILVFAYSALPPPQHSREILSLPALITDCYASEAREWVQRDWKGVCKEGTIIFS